uniref:50S ribosomal protein L19, chloroplastic n=1 Tax=Pteridomonas sp. YPF1301 TaxID=2766739 RepID=A0A7G1MTZ7_9STRA|nr:ribosomal protein L19 [Pteridomonas sp. YPF1301]
MIKTVKYNLQNIFDIGDYITLGIDTLEKHQIRIYEYSGFIIGQKNKGVNKTLILRNICKGISIDRYVLIYSPEILFIKINNSVLLDRSKGYTLYTF